MKPMMVADFDELIIRDFGNRAVIDSIREALVERETMISFAESEEKRQVEGEKEGEHSILSCAERTDVEEEAKKTLQEMMDSINVMTTLTDERFDLAEERLAALEERMDMLGKVEQGGT